MGLRSRSTSGIGATVGVIEIAVIAGFDTVADAIAAEPNRGSFKRCSD
tara:strand:- start:572 stop:715 length:144 start_codon:yes stop_codon:yes gene_type:complete